MPLPTCHTCQRVLTGDVSTTSANQRFLVRVQNFVCLISLICILLGILATFLVLHFVPGHEHDFLPVFVIAGGVNLPILGVILVAQIILRRRFDRGTASSPGERDRLLGERQCHDCQRSIGMGGPSTYLPSSLYP